MTGLLTPRLAVPDDSESLFDMCCQLWEENGIFPMSEEKVRRMIEIAVKPDERRDWEPITIIGALGPVGDVEGCIALCVTQSWYSDAWHLEELWNFVRPDKRRSNHAKSLIEYSKSIQRQMGLPLMIGILSSDHTQEKIRLYARRFGEQAGAYWVYPSWTELRDQKKQAAA